MSECDYPIISMMCLWVFNDSLRLWRQSVSLWMVDLTFGFSCVRVCSWASSLEVQCHNVDAWGMMCAGRKRLRVWYLG